MRPESPRVTGNPRNAMVFDTPYLQNEFGDPRFFLRNSTKYRADDFCGNLICEYFCWMLGSPHFFSADHFLL